MKVYVYQVSDTEYHAGYVRSVCERKGKIVEEWPVDTEEQIKFLERHGSKYGNVAAEVTDLASRARSAGKAEQYEQELKDSAVIELACRPFRERVRLSLKVLFGRM